MLTSPARRPLHPSEALEALLLGRNGPDGPHPDDRNVSVAPAHHAPQDAPTTRDT